MGRKQKYETHIKPNFNKIVKWRQEGRTEEQIAELLDISHATWYAYKSKKPEFKELLLTCKEGLIADLEQTLFQRAKGIYYEEIKTISGEFERTEKTKKFLAPDTTALIFSLKNLAPEKWRDRQEINHGGSLQMQFIDDLGDDEDES